jgi:hypothetical protein
MLDIAVVSFDCFFYALEQDDVIPINEIEWDETIRSGLRVGDKRIEERLFGWIKKRTEMETVLLNNKIHAFVESLAYNTPQLEKKYTVYDHLY